MSSNVIVYTLHKPTGRHTMAFLWLMASVALKTPVWRSEGVYEYIHENALMFINRSA